MSEAVPKPKSKAQLRRDRQRARKAQKNFLQKSSGEPCSPKKEKEAKEKTLVEDMKTPLSKLQPVSFKRTSIPQGHGSYYKLYWDGMDEKKRNEEKVKEEALAKIEKKLAEYDAQPKNKIEIKVPKPTSFRFCFICHKSVSPDATAHHFHRKCVRAYIRQIRKEYAEYDKDYITRGLKFNGFREVFYFYTPVYDAMCYVLKPPNRFLTEETKITDEEYQKIYDRIDELYYGGHSLYFEGSHYYSCNCQICDAKGLAKPRTKRSLEYTFWLMTKDRELETEFKELVGDEAFIVLYFDRSSYVSKRHKHFEIIFIEETQSPQIGSQEGTLSAQADKLYDS
jgi:hypothetical protein